ncbi:hypothetical protein [Phytopseudomonas dryadis]|uniref:Uncharacterized protein n=1 Tax=Phytopseudomonas dryadis TaxID=2487520 RepID=A0A4Q9QXN3_9GAMM|nr:MULTISPECIES: hypothetical protein [Pseudomonas]TBU89711.1 hypothetical protein DNK44_16290 [Pseudomonas dryadis]TBV06018.1 hypothetical protein DNK34_12405 [Pseudomonas dryadis]TBV18159.1 hypothetical protein DNK41_10655 [Pseudomonas sp. FRB 230]
MRPLRKRLAAQPRPRIFARLDEHGICRAFRLSAQAPGSAHWREVNEQRLSWLDKPLPDSALAVH